ncbi:polyamine ABC transporter substrate-binding protein [Pseudomonas sp. SGAir0191]|uniref:polyamine ABC transporter substrate-binding protein n=1 Tax=Pseudomonas sp. SGAir0191 TaxID=2217867 RepID=UPI000C2CB27B|nr:polyamine ABC transporter substrate-binding protein [Pseudomonas sp. SGAir0191]AUA33343.1 polyamine ABC transporter substrate-binding protein [Pseudomonas sp. SGAir0191]
MSSSKGHLRSFLATLAILTSTAATCAPNSVVNIYNWADYINPSVLIDFQRSKAIAVNYDIFDSNETLEAKLLTGHSGYDVVVPSSHFLERLRQAGVFAKLDKSLLPNYANLDPAILNQLEQNDPGNLYAVPYLWGTSGVAYNVDKVKQVLGVEAIDSWAALFDPAIVSKLHRCGVAVMDSPDELYGAALHYLGKDVRHATLADYRSATALIEKIRPFITYFHSSKFVSDLANGEICFAIANSGDGVQAINSANEAHGGIRLAYVVPKEGGNLWFDVLAIPAGSRHVKEAHAFINFLLDPRNMAKVTTYTGYTNPTPASKAYLPDSIVRNTGVYPDATMIQRLYVSTQPAAGYVRYVTRAWNMIKNSH